MTAMSLFPRKNFTRSIIFSIFFFSAQSLYAQSAVERATRETDILGDQQKIQERLREVPEKPPEPTIREVPTQPTGKKFFIKKIKLAGCEYIPCSDFDPMLAKYENREVTLNELEALCKDIEREYLQRNIVAAVVVPAQDIKDQTVILQVVEAKMGALLIQEEKYFNAERLRYYWKIPRGSILRYDEISQSIQMMNKNPDRSVKSALAAGKKPGTTDVILTADTNFPIHGTYSWDNEGVVTSGKNRLGYGMRHNNFLGLDDTFMGGSNQGRSFGGTYFYHNLPIGYRGLSTMYGYSRSWSKPLMEFANTGLKSEQVNSTFSLHQDLYSHDDYLGEVNFGFNAKDKVVKYDGGLINRDRQRMFSLGANLMKRNAGSSSSLGATATQGVAAFGASSKNNPYASRGAGPVFTKLNLNLQHRKALPYNFQANLRFQSQVAFNKLTPQEEYGIGGIDSVRGYPASDYQADTAALSSVEILIPAFFVPDNWKIPYAEDTLKNQTTPLVFMDYGWGMRRGALPTEKAYVNDLGIGAGVRFSLFNQALLRLEWGFPIGANNPITENVRGRFHFSVDFQEKLPEEIERIRKAVEEEHIQQWAQRLVREELSLPDSPVRKKIDGLLQLTAKAREQGNTGEVNIINQKISSLNASLYRQAEDYVRSLAAKEKELQQYRKLAEASYNEGKIDEARQLWEKILAQGTSPKPLIFEY